MRQQYLIDAQNYALNRGDDDLFCEVYGNYREFMSIQDSVYFSLAYLYGHDTARMIENNSKG